MDIFNTAGNGRGSNDKNNNTREEILSTLYHSESPDHQELRQKWKCFLQTLCDEPYDNVTVKRRGGRGANYDFDISYSMVGRCVKSVKAEFKHNAHRIDKLPQYFSPAADKPYLPRLYADVFYDSLDLICGVYPGLLQYKPDRETYMRLVHGDGYDRHVFFQTLYDMEVNGTREQYKQKQAIVRSTIAAYLSENVTHLRLGEISNDIRNRQSGKIFILWTLKEFRSDFIRDDEMDITHVDKIKNKNTIVIVSKAGTKHNMLLRWKNHLGVMYPAWQISLSR